ncbi:MAG: hypothetical protein ACK5O2_05790 [Microthrixaceae bacterium]
MSNQGSQGDGRSRGTTIGLVLSLLCGIVWVVYGLTGAPQWLLVVAIVWSMLVGGWWAFARTLVDDAAGR